MSTGASQDATTTQLEPILAPQSKAKPRRILKPPSVQAAVMAKYSQGDNKSQIASDLNISRGTVYAILSQSDIEQQVLEGRSRVVQLIPKAIAAVENRLAKNDGSVAIGVLRGTQVLVNQQATTNVTNNFAVMLAQLEQTRQSDARDNDISTAIEVTAAK